MISMDGWFDYDKGKVLSRRVTIQKKSALNIHFVRITLVGLFMVNITSKKAFVFCFLNSLLVHSLSLSLSLSLFLFLLLKRYPVFILECKILNVFIDIWLKCEIEVRVLRVGLMFLWKISSNKMLFSSKRSKLQS